MHLSAFIGIKPEEKIVHVLRRDPVTFLPKILLTLMLLIVPIALSDVVANVYPTLYSNTVLYPIIMLALSAYLLSILLFFYTAFIIFYLDVSIITTDRIIDVEQLGLFARRVAEFDLFRIQDVTADVEGFMPTLFNYGTLEIKTASVNMNLIFHNIAHPNRIREELIQLAHADRANRNIQAE